MRDGVRSLLFDIDFASIQLMEHRLRVLAQNQITDFL